jgi:hypothetical protein
MVEYTYDQIFSKNDAVINRLIAIHIMNEPEPTFEGKHMQFSEHGWWICVDRADEKGCEWDAINFTGNMKWCWQIIKRMKNEPPHIREHFRFFLEQLKPLEADTEREACKQICRAALLSKLSRIPKPI